MLRLLPSIIRLSSWRAPSRAVALPLALLGALVASCGGGDEPTDPILDPDVPVARVEFAVGHVTIDVGARLALRARVLDARGRELSGREVVWSSRDQGVATIDGSGVVWGMWPGVTEIVATVEGRQASLALTVVHVPIGSITISGVPQQMRVGDQGLIRTLARSASGAVLPNPLYDYASSDTTVAKVDPAGFFTAVGVGRAVFTVRAGDVSATASTEVLARRVSTVRIARPAPWLLPGERDSLVVTTHAIDDSLLTGRVITYESSDPSVVSVSPEGVMTAHAPGSSRIVVRSEQAFSAFSMAVLPERPVEVVVAPSSRTILRWRSMQIGAQLRGASGALLESDALYATYESSDPSVAWVTWDGGVYTEAPGHTEVRVRVGDLVGTSTITVESAPKSEFGISIIPVDSLDIDVHYAAVRAAERWSRVILGGLDPQPVQLPRGACDDWTPPIDTVVDDLAIFVRIEKIDGLGGVLAMAGPCAFRGYGDHQPVLGVISVDRSDLSTLQHMDGMLDELLTHEIGHVLGIGTTWNFSGIRELVPDGADPRFAGSVARDAAGRLGFADAAALGIPVEDLGGDGTAGAHWRESVFGTELMTGWISEGRNPLSTFTVGALADLGYVVHEGDAGSLIGLPKMLQTPWHWREQAAPASSASSATSASATVRREMRSTRRLRVTERLVQPRFQVDRHGRATPVEGRRRR